MWLRVCREEDVPADGVAGFAVEGIGVPVMVARVGEQITAASSICPHEDVSLLSGERDGDEVVCPGHGYIFDLASGQCVHDPLLRLRSYRVEVRAGEIWIDPMRGPD